MHAELATSRPARRARSSSRCVGHRLVECRLVKAVPTVPSSTCTRRGGAWGQQSAPTLPPALLVVDATVDQRTRESWQRCGQKVGRAGGANVPHADAWGIEGRAGLEGSMGGERARLAARRRSTGQDFSLSSATISSALGEKTDSIADRICRPHLVRPEKKIACKVSRGPTPYNAMICVSAPLPIRRYCRPSGRQSNC